MKKVIVLFERNIFLLWTLKILKPLYRLRTKTVLQKRLKKLGYTQSAVSAQIKQLEHAYGVLLF
ncbi:MAG: LysR family transcriptional regulator [Eubacterium sp.]|uniref:LysR family transcriptional regulator n=1 Tax=Eubacterium sp. TaxID=142586 RepID=UPI0039A1CEAC